MTDKELLELCAESRSELFPTLRREGSLTPLVVLLAILPGLFALVNNDVNSAEARWGLDSLELVSSFDAESIASRGGLIGDDPAWQRPLPAALTGLSLRASAGLAVVGVSLPFVLALVPFLCTAGIVLVWHSLCQLSFGPRFAFWSTALLAFHGPFLAHVQSALPASMGTLLALCALWGLIAHLRDPDAVVSIRLLLGGVSLGLCLLTGGLQAIAVVAVGVMLAVALRLDAGKVAAGSRESLVQLRERWTALKSVLALALTAFAAGGWWPLMMAARNGPAFWGAWLGFDRLAEAGRLQPGGLQLAEASLFRFVDLLGVLLAPALFGMWRAGHVLWQPQEDKSRRMLLQLFSAWLVCGLALWSAASSGMSSHGGAWDLFVLLPLVGCAAFAVEEVAARRVAPLAAVWLVFLALVLPRSLNVFRDTPAGASIAGMPGTTLAVVGCFLAFAMVSAWLLTSARRRDVQQRACLAGLLLLLAVANAVQGLKSVQLTDEDRGLRYLLTSFHDRLAELGDVDAQILITDSAAPPDVELVIRSLRPELSIERTESWNRGIVRAAELLSETRRTVLVVDWRSIEGRTARPPERNLTIESRFPPVSLHDRRLTAYLLARRIQPL